MKKLKFKSSEEVARVFQGLLKRMDTLSKEKEYFWTMALNPDNEMKYVEEVAKGSLNAVIAHPREIFRKAVIEGVAALVVIHNHPTGNLKPTREDLEFTEQLVLASDYLGIALLDHLIINETEYFSFLKIGIIPKNKDKLKGGSFLFSAEGGDKRGKT